MIKLESTAGLLASCHLSVQSSGEHGVVSVSTEPARAQGSDGRWVDDPTKLRQVVRFTTPEGQVELSGVVPESEAVECPAAWRVVVSAAVVERSLPAYEAGQRSRAITGLSLRRVVEVWGAAGKRLWSAATPLGGPAREVDLSNGKVGKLS